MQPQGSPYVLDGPAPVLTSRRGGVLNVTLTVQRNPAANASAMCYAPIMQSLDSMRIHTREWH